MIKIFYKNKKKSKIFQESFQNIFYFLACFAIILYNIGLYIYTIRYKSSIKIPGLLQNIS